MKRVADDRPAVFKTFPFDSFDESAAFVAQLGRLYAEAVASIQARVTKNGVRIRIDPPSEMGKAEARRLLKELLILYRRGY